MKTLVKHLFLVFTLVFGTALSQSCSNDGGYSLDKFAVGIATVVNQPGSDWYLRLDSGEKLWIAAGIPNYKPLDGQRAIIDFTLLSDETNGFDHMIRLNRIWEMRTKTIELALDEETLLEFGEDRCPIVASGFPNGIWISENKEYLNLVVAVYSQKYAVSLVDNMLDDSYEDGYKHLELRYNAFDTEVDYAIAQTYSFVLKDLAISGLKGLKIKRINAKNEEEEIVLNFDTSSQSYSQAFTSDLNIVEEPVVGRIQ